jgi:hypothetical protein
MPYINSANRLDLTEITDEILCTEIRSAGELNYLITKLWLEFYQRYAAPYEDTKIIQNGDVYNA